MCSLVFSVHNWVYQRYLKQTNLTVKIFTGAAEPLEAPVLTQRRGARTRQTARKSTPVVEIKAEGLIQEAAEHVSDAKQPGENEILYCNILYPVFYTGAGKRSHTWGNG